MLLTLATLSTSLRTTSATSFHITRISRATLKPLQASFTDNSQMAFSTSISANDNDGDTHYTVGITGSSGLLGTALIDELSKIKDGILNGKRLRIVKLIRSESIDSDAATNKDSDCEEIITSQAWNPNADSASPPISLTSLESMDVVVHLAGENVATSLLPGPLAGLGVRAWSKEKKSLIRDSRVGPTEALARTIAEASKPTTFIVASGVGVYGSDFMEDDGKMTADESFDTNKAVGFLADLSRLWEAAAEVAKSGENDTRVVNLRLAPVLSKLGGALGKLYPIFWMGGGGNVGSGKQYFPFISARDAARAIVHIIETPSLAGPVNIVAPTSCTNAQFTKTLGKIMSRPTIIPFPAFAVKLLFGEMGEEMLLGGVKATPKKLVESGFEFQHNTIEEGLKSAMTETI